MKYGIVVDSGCDLKGLKKEVAHNIDFKRVALNLDIGEKVFTDDYELNIEEFMKEMYAYKGKTGSAAPSPDDWYQAYAQSDEVFVITIAGALSASYSSAKTAMNLFIENHPMKKIHLIDCTSIGPKMSLLVRKLTEYIEQRLSFEEICPLIDTYNKQAHLLFILQSLDNIVKNGRISKLKASMAGVLGIKILGTTDREGNLELLQKCRGKYTIYDKAIEELIAEGFQGGRVVLAHCFAPEIADYVSTKLKEQWPACDIEIMTTSGLCSYYCERGGLLIGFES